MSEDVFAAADGPKDRSRSLAWRNRRVLAERLGWPERAVATCQAIELAWPGWTAAWFGEWKVGANSYWHREAGFYAWRISDQPLISLGHGLYGRRPELYGADAQAITERLGRSA